MRVLITGAAGNLGSFLANHLLDGPHHLNLMVHRTDLPFDVSGHPNVTVHRADLGVPATLVGPCRGVDCIVHFAGVLFAPRPEEFLPGTNVGYVKNLVAAALKAGVKKFILVSFPHVEGETTPDDPAVGRLDGEPGSVHARTRLEAERHLFRECEGTGMTPVVLRSGMVYGRGVLMIEAGKRLARYRLLAVWPQPPTWIHLISLPDFLRCCVAAIEKDVEGIYNIGDDAPLTLQDFADRACARLGYPRPRRMPLGFFYVLAGLVEGFALVFGTRAVITRDFIRIGAASYAMDTSRMKEELISELEYPTLEDGLGLL